MAGTVTLIKTGRGPTPYLVSSRPPSANTGTIARQPETARKGNIPSRGRVTAGRPERPPPPPKTH